MIVRFHFALLVASACCPACPASGHVGLLRRLEIWLLTLVPPAFDEGAYAHDPVKAAEEVIFTLAVLDDLHPPVSADEDPVRHALQSCWQRFSRLAPPQLRYRWKRQLTTYTVGVLQQVSVQGRAGGKPLTIEEYMEYRAGCVGAYPCLGLME